MSTIAVGASASFNLGDGQNLEIATNGGFYSVSITPTLTGRTTSSVQGPTAHGHTFGPYAGGAVVSVTNQTVDTLTVVAPAATYTAAQAAAGATGVIAADAAGNAYKLDGTALSLTTTAAAINALGLPTAWNASTNTPTLTSGVAPAGNNAFTVTVAGTVNLGNGITAESVNDIVYFDGTQWQIILASAALGIVTSSLLKGNGAGGAAAATLAVDYAAPMNLQCGVPVGIAPAGTVGSNGALTITGTAFGTTYSTPGVWLYFPANALTGANAAGFYWTVMSSTTAGTVYNTTYTPGTNTGAGSWAVPAAPTAFSGTTGGAYTNATATDITCFQLTVAGNFLGKNGSVEAAHIMRCPSSATGKTAKTKFGAGTNPIVNENVTTNVCSSRTGVMANKGDTGKQMLYVSLQLGSNGNVPQFNTVDTTASQNVTGTLQINSTAEWAVLEFYRVMATPSPQ